MSVEYKSVSGIGVRISKEIIDRFISENRFTEDEFSDDPEGCFESLRISFVGHVEYYGNQWSGVIEYCILIEGNNLTEILENEKLFIESLKNIGLNVTRDELEVISEILVY